MASLAKRKAEAEKFARQVLDKIDRVEHKSYMMHDSADQAPSKDLTEIVQAAATEPASTADEWKDIWRGVLMDTHSVEAKVACKEGKEVWGSYGEGSREGEMGRFASALTMAHCGCACCRASGALHRVCRTMLRNALQKR